MRLAIVSDTHDNDEVVRKAVDRMRTRDVDLVLHCGDVAEPQTVRLFAGLTTHFVFGNWDGDLVGGSWRKPAGKGRWPHPAASSRDRTRLRQAIEQIGGTAHEPFGELELEGRSIGWVHGNFRHQLRELEEADYFDYLFYGHTHEQEQHRTGRTLVVNPGALYRADAYTFAILDLPEGRLEILPVPATSKAGR
jgi:putative phosphoesterase